MRNKQVNVDNSKGIIEAPKQPRAGWFDGYQAKNDEAMLDSILVDEDSDEWEW